MEPVISGQKQKRGVQNSGKLFDFCFVLFVCFSRQMLEGTPLEILDIEVQEGCPRSSRPIGWALDPLQNGVLQNSVS